jgi:hypothetical protein
MIGSHRYAAEVIEEPRWAPAAPTPPDDRRSLRLVALARKLTCPAGSGFVACSNVEFSTTFLSLHGR